MSDHLTPEDFFEFIDRGGSSGGLAPLVLPGVSVRAGLDSAGGSTGHGRGGSQAQVGLPLSGSLVLPPPCTGVVRACILRSV